MGPLRDGELLWVSKECLPWAIACRESFFLHKRLQSTPFHWTTYFFYTTGNRPPPSYCKASQLYHICRTPLSSIWDTLHHTAFQLRHWKLSPGKLSCQQSTSCPRLSLPWLPVSLLTGLPSGLPACAPVQGFRGSWRTGSNLEPSPYRLRWHRVPLPTYCESTGKTSTKIVLQPGQNVIATLTFPLGNKKLTPVHLFHLDWLKFRPPHLTGQGRRWDREGITKLFHLCSCWRGFDETHRSQRVTSVRH